LLTLLCFLTPAGGLNHQQEQKFLLSSLASFVLFSC